MVSTPRLTGASVYVILTRSYVASEGSYDQDDADGYSEEQYYDEEG